MVQTAPDPSARTRSGITCWRAFRIGIGTNMPTTWRAFSGEGYSALTIDPLGAVTLIGASEP